MLRTIRKPGLQQGSEQKPTSQKWRQGVPQLGGSHRGTKAPGQRVCMMATVPDTLRGPGRSIHPGCLDELVHVNTRGWEHWLPLSGGTPGLSPLHPSLPAGPSPPYRTRPSMQDTPTPNRTCPTLSALRAPYVPPHEPSSSAFGRLCGEC